MISIFVAAKNKAGEPIFADHREFKSVPRVGDQVVVNESGTELILKVVAVTHFEEPRGDIMSPVSHIHIDCDQVE